MPYCPNCGNKLTDAMLFCPQCGTKSIIPKAGFKEDKDTRISDYTIETKTKKPETVGHGLKKGKLYKQWVEYAGLLPEEIPPTKTPGEMPVGVVERRKQYPDVIFILLGVIILILCVGLVFLFTKL